MTPEHYEALQAWAAQYNDCALFADGYEDAVLGVAERCGVRPVVVYDAMKCIEILMARDGMSMMEASEYFEHNTLGSWVGDNSPVFLWRYRPAAPDDFPPAGIAA